MSNSPLVTHTNISPNRNHPRNHAIDTITIHHMACNITVERCGAGFARPERQGSSNYGVDGYGHVGLYVPEEDRAWTSGSGANDHRAVTIEVANDGGAPDWHVSDTAYFKLLDLVEDICRRNGIKQLNYTGDKTGNLTLHKWFQATGCPGPYLESKMPEIAAEINRRLNGGKPITILPVNMTYQVFDTVKNKWLPDVVNRNDYAGNPGHPFSGVKINANLGNVFYRAHIISGGWLSEIKNRDNYAGRLASNTDGIMIRSDITNVHYQVELLDGTLLPAVTGYDVNDRNNGYAGVLGKPIAKLWVWADPIRQEEPKPEPQPEPTPTPTPSKDVSVTYRVYDKTKKKWLPSVSGYNVNDNNNGYAGNIGNPITGFCIKDDIANDLEYGVGLQGAGWLGIVNGYDPEDVQNGYAGRGDLNASPAIDRIMIRSKSGRTCAYKACIIRNGKTEWLPEVTGFNRADSNNGYAGWVGYPICAIAVKVTGVDGASVAPAQELGEPVAQTEEPVAPTTPEIKPEVKPILNTVLCGDANDDGEINSKDIVRLKKYLADNSVEIGPGADVNQDGTIDDTDLQLLKEFIADYEEENGEVEVITEAPESGLIDTIEDTEGVVIGSVGVTPDVTNPPANEENGAGEPNVEPPTQKSFFERLLEAILNWFKSLFSK